jgi:hypothetical protein
MLEGFYEGLFESCYNDVKSRWEFDVKILGLGDES